MSNLPLRSRIFFGMAMVVLAATLGMGLGVGSTTEDFAHKAIVEELSTARRGIEKYLESRYRLLESYARQASRYPQLQAALAEIEEAEFASRQYDLTMVDQAEQLRRALKTDWVAYTLAGRTVFSSCRDKLIAPELKRDSGPLADALTGESFTGALDSAEGVYIAAAIPITGGGAILGGLLVGERVDRAMVAEFYDAVGADVLVAMGDKPVSWFVEGDREFDAVALAQAVVSSSTTKAMRVGGERFVTATALGERSQLILSRTADALVEVRQFLWFWVTFFGLLAALGATAFSRWLANRLTSPIRDLVQVADQIADGDLSAKAGEIGMEETASLGRSFNRMTGQVRELIADISANAEILREQKDELERADEVKTHFMVSASHELRTPVTNIASATEILLQHGGREDPDTCREFLEAIDQETDRLSDLLHRLLELTKIEAGLAQWCEIEFDLCQAVEECFASFAAEHPGRPAQFRPGAVRIECCGDRDRLQQLLDQLLENVAKFTPEGSALAVEALADEEVCEVRVVDRGPGIEEKERVFERFVQGGDLLTDKPSGVGLGLPICREIARGFGGSIVCEDSPGGGATFVLSIPRRTRR